MAHSEPHTGTGVRRRKIYCDKWVHEGVCAFTQVGCRYLHQMPTDRVTLTSLGLPHGPPAWWRRQHQPILRATDGRVSPTSQHNSSNALSKPVELSKPRSIFPTASATNEKSSAIDMADYIDFGPIAPPRKLRLSTMTGNTPTYSRKGSVDMKEEGEVDEFEDLVF